MPRDKLDDNQMNIRYDGIYLDEHSELDEHSNPFVIC